jgi:hypothetical protein
MRLPRMTTRVLMALIVITAVLLALVIQQKREVAMRVEYEERLSVVLVDLRDLRNRELRRLEADYLRLRRELMGENAKAEADPRVKAMIVQLDRARLDFNENVDQLKVLRASLKRLQAMGFPGRQVGSAPAAKPVQSPIR